MDPRLDASGNVIPWPFKPPSPPGFSQLQTGSPISDHDPFDSRKIDPSAFRLIPLIYSAGATNNYGINLGPPSPTSYHFAATHGDMFSNTTFLSIGTPTGTAAAGNPRITRLSSGNMAARSTKTRRASPAAAEPKGLRFVPLPASPTVPGRLCPRHPPLPLPSPLSPLPSLAALR